MFRVGTSIIMCQFSPSTYRAVVNGWLMGTWATGAMLGTAWG